MTAVIEKAIESKVVDTKVEVKKGNWTVDKRKEFSKAQALERLGETLMNIHGDLMFIAEYNNSQDITVQFVKTKELVECSYIQFQRRTLKSHFTPSVCGVGIVGKEATRDENGKLLDSFVCWSSMLNRAYSAKFHEKYPTYKGCGIEESWLIYANFKTWYKNNFYEIKELGRTNLDKDVLVKNNKIYSSSNCVFLPQALNKLFTKRDSKRGKYPIGVFLHEGGKYQASCSIGKGTQYLGYHGTPEKAFTAYKVFKEERIKQIAKSYKTQIPQKLYEAMMNYTVSIDD